MSFNRAKFEFIKEYLLSRALTQKQDLDAVESVYRAEHAWELMNRICTPTEALTVAQVQELGNAVNRGA